LIRRLALSSSLSTFESISLAALSSVQNIPTHRPGSSNRCFQVSFLDQHRLILDFHTSAIHSDRSLSPAQFRSSHRRWMSSPWVEKDVHEQALHQGLVYYIRGLKKSFWLFRNIKGEWSSLPRIEFSLQWLSANAYCPKASKYSLPLVIASWSLRPSDSDANNDLATHFFTEWRAGNMKHPSG
jgi:hypothetical protein